MTPDTGHMTPDTWYVSMEWHVTHDMWHVTSDMWHKEEGEYFLKISAPSSNGLGSMMTWKVGGKWWVNQWISYLMTNVFV